MRNRILVSAVAIGLASAAVFAADQDNKKVSGVLIDQACAARYMKKDDPQAAAEKHPVSCCLKENCAASGYEVISGKNETKIDNGSNVKVKEYLEKEGASTKVDITGTQNADGTITIGSIEPQK
jgi:hypothetical protein